MKLLLIALMIGAVLAAGMAVFVWSGVYNVAASEPHSAFVHWLFATVRDRSIAARSPSSEIHNLTDPDRVRGGIRSYQAMCRVCHGRPGEKSTPIREGLNPQPPKLDSDRIRNRTDAELFWIIKNGIRMTGMPAFGKTHKDQDLWSIVAFVRHLPNMRPDEYAAMVKEAGAEEAEPGAEHHH
jgi:mono/diheme cytochrome c family protein